MPRSQSACEYSDRVFVECSASILACSQTHGTHLENRETFFFNLLAPNEPSAAFFGNSRGSASAQCEPVSMNTGRLADRSNELERNTQHFALLTPRFARKFSTWNLPSRAEGAYP